MAAQKGHEAEEALANYFRQTGLFAIRGVPFRHDEEEITDIDVWLLERGFGPKRRRYLVDTKNKKSPRVGERVLWSAGLRQALGLDGAFVASTGTRPATERLAKRVGVHLLDISALGNLADLTDPDRLTQEEVRQVLKDLDQRSEAKTWRRNQEEMLAALLLAFGGSSANIAMRGAAFYVEQALSSPPASTTQQWGIRMTLTAASLVAAALDYAGAPGVYHANERRKNDIEDAIRFGSSPDEAKARMRFAIDVIRADPSAKPVASQIESRLKQEVDDVPADLLAEVTVKLMPNGQLFEVARTLDRLAHTRGAIPGVDSTSKAFLGALFDFLGIERTKIFDLIPTDATSERRTRDRRPQGTAASENEPTLFEKK